MKILSTIPSLVSVHKNCCNTSSRQLPKWLSAWEEMIKKKMDVNPCNMMSINECALSSVCFQISIFPASPAISQPMNPVTSALISGVVILGVVGATFFLLSVHLLQKSRLQRLWNPTLKWLYISLGDILEKMSPKIQTQVHVCIPLYTNGFMSALFWCRCLFIVWTL